MRIGPPVKKWKFSRPKEAQKHADGPVWMTQVLKPSWLIHFWSWKSSLFSFLALRSIQCKRKWSIFTRQCYPWMLHLFVGLLSLYEIGKYTVIERSGSGIKIWNLPPYFNAPATQTRQIPTRPDTCHLHAWMLDEGSTPQLVVFWTIFTFLLNHEYLNQIVLWGI